MARGKKQFLIRDVYRHDHYATRWAADFGIGPSSHFLHTFDGFHNFNVYGPAPYAWIPPRKIRGAPIFSTNHTTNTPAPALSQLHDLLITLERQIQENNPEELAKLLRADFIFEHQALVTKKNLYLDTPSEVQGNVYTYQVCDAQPTIELLVLEHNQTFRQLLAKAKEVDLKTTPPDASKSLYRTIIKQLHHLNLEGADLSELDLDEGDLSHSHCKQANFRKSTMVDAVCISTDFQKTSLTKKQLESCKTYAGAKLELDFWPYWTEDTKKKVLSGLDDLRAYGKKLQSQGLAKGDEAVKLAGRLTAYINEPNAKYNETFQRKFLQDLHSQDKLFDQHRSYKRIIANIALCVVSGIIGYLIAGAINKKLTGHFTFFVKTTTHKKVEAIDQTFSHPTPPMTTFLLGTHSRLGKKSPIRPFFGHVGGKPQHPIGDNQMLPLIKGFLY